MAALFAACVNDDFETIGQQDNAVNDGRPVVGNVELNFTKGGADTRLIYDHGYAWEATDEIGALLMDNVITDKPETESLTWLEKYGLIDKIHTSYRFTYDVDNKVWGCDAKMLEGNYFFAYPWESYNGERRVKHSLTNQTQEGVSAEVRAKSYADNQFFIGYSQIMAGTEDTEVLDSSVEMVPVLGAIQLKIVNTGTQTRHINKVVLKGAGLKSTLTFDPTDAEYGTTADGDKWNLQGAGYTNYFNYANYTGNEEDVYSAANTDFVYNIEDGDKYSRIEALRAVVKGDETDTDEYAQINITGTDEERALLANAKNTAYVLIMANAHEIVTGEDLQGLMMDIYTDEGYVMNVDLTEIPPVGSSTKEYGALIDSKVEKIAPDVANTIGVQIDDNSFRIPEEMSIYTDEDLLQLIEWNCTVSGKRDVTATLAKPEVTLTAEMAEMLAKKSNLILTIDGTEALNLGEDVPADILDYENLIIATPVEVQGTINITANSDLPESIATLTEPATSTLMTIEEGAVLNINDEIDEENNDQFNVVNKGTVNIAAKDIAVNGKFTNNAEMTVGAGADVKATVTNTKAEKDVDAIITNNGYMQEVNNGAEAEVNLGTGAIIASGTNAKEGIIRTADKASVSLTSNAGDVVYVKGAVISIKAGDGDIAYEAASTINSTLYKELTKAGVTKLIVTGTVSVETADKTADSNATPSFDKIVGKSGSLTVDEGVELSANSLTVEGTLTTDGVITIDGEVVVEKDAILTNNGTINSTDFTYSGRVNNNGIVNVENAVEKGQGGSWMYNEAIDSTNAKYLATKKAVEGWSNYWYTFMANKDQTVGTQTYKDFYAGNPTDITGFVNAMNVWANAEGNDMNETAVKLKEAYEVTGDLTATTAGLKTNFTTAVTNYLNTLAADAAKVLWPNDKFFSTGWSADKTAWTETQDMYDNMCERINTVNNIEALAATQDDASYAQAAKYTAYTWVAQATTFSKLIGTHPYAYVWVGNELDKAIDVWKSFDGKLSTIETAVDGNEFTDAKVSDTSNSTIAAKLVNWIVAVKNADATNDAVKEAQAAINAINATDPVTVSNASTKFGGYNDAQCVALESTLKSN